MAITSGSLDRNDNARPVLRFERRLRHPPEKVWRAVTDPAHLKHWFPAELQTEQRIGAPITFVFPGAEAPPGSGEILEFDPPRVFAFSWKDANSQDTTVLRFELVPADEGCLLTFTHALGGPGDLLATARHAAGWDGSLDVLEGVLAGHEVESTRKDWFRRAERYVEEFGIATGECVAVADGFLLRAQRDLVHPKEKVWAELTKDDPAVLGAAPPLRATHGYQAAGTVTELDAPDGLTYTWLHEDEPAGVVRWQLTEQPFGSLLTVTQTIPAHLADLRAVTLAAWQTHLELFFAALFGEIRCPWPTDRTEDLRQRYAKTLNA
ncbi:SRPBCC family protein [Crossiella sp. CA-258035]|uniref:SRPBCC family protein n=1 Tax=Crossiella sp. CA-258035 TaxID=2981138 RepID=UPI0024BC61D2|nr:SRPBCC family protein [Crossiella sp. CA-258035]WHT16835.1 SRPBCC family protein [Crossiella sp. CA-258035]